MFVANMTDIRIQYNFLISFKWVTRNLKKTLRVVFNSIHPEHIYLLTFYCVDNVLIKTDLQYDYKSGCFEKNILLDWN